MSNVLVKIGILKPYLYKDNVIEALIYRFEDLKWSRETLKYGLSIESIYTEAHNTLMKKIQEIDLGEGYLLVEIEGIGLKAFRLEGGVKEVFKILYPIPQPLNKIIIYRRNENGYSKVHEVVFTSEYWVYDGYINVKDIEWDLLVIESNLYRKVISRREYEEFTPPIKLVEKKKRRRRIKKSSGRKNKKKRRRSGRRT
ncbi:MAG: hypothetical protein QXM54_02500 [Desulfurococcaceae archaeon]|uniref:Uncharacterized protein n=1 Tax=Staphylothermus marinus TaxID=2280 RepID=A0A7C4NNI9_STAMA